VGLRTAVDLARFEELSDVEYQQRILLRRGLVLSGELRAAVAALTPGRGTQRAGRAAASSDGRAESPPESRLRLLLTLAGTGRWGSDEGQRCTRGDHAAQPQAKSCVHQGPPGPWATPTPSRV